MKKYIYPVFIFSIVLSFAVETNAQNFGFGCLGLSGIYGGYSIQQYDAAGLNQSIENYFQNLGIANPEMDFNEGQGFRVGGNIFRAKFANFFLTLKGFYQFLSEEQKTSGQTDTGVLSSTCTLELNHWGVGVDVGFPLLQGFIDLKLAEGGVLFYSTKFKIESSLDNVANPDVKYKESDTNMGYYVGTGLIIHLIPNYVSLEGTAMYNFMKVENLSGDDGSIFPGSAVDKNFVEAGKLAAAVQLNIGFPL